jgi:hypothetical protein
VIDYYRVADDRPAISYGPAGTDGPWILAVTTESEGRVEIALDEESMYDLWIETRGVPWPFAEQHDAEEERLARQVVHAVTGADKDGLRNALEALGVRDD